MGWLIDLAKVAANATSEIPTSEILTVAAEALRPELPGISPEFAAGLPKPEVELEAARITASLARNRGDLWASLRAALADYPPLLTVLPDTPGPVDTLGMAKLAVLPGRRVVRQGVFSGGQEVKG